MRFEVIAHAVRSDDPRDQGWTLIEWEGSKAFNTPSAWHRYFQFVGLRLAVTIFSDDWTLDYETARTLAIELWQGKRSYCSYPLNEDKPKWRRVW